jgi:hypothetical protein
MKTDNPVLHVLQLSNEIIDEWVKNQEFEDEFTYKRIREIQTTLQSLTNNNNSNPNYNISNPKQWKKTSFQADPKVWGFIKQYAKENSVTISRIINDYFVSLIKDNAPHILYQRPDKNQMTLFEME